MSVFAMHSLSKLAGAVHIKTKVAGDEHAGLIKDIKSNIGVSTRRDYYKIDHIMSQCGLKCVHVRVMRFILSCDTTS